MIVILIKINSLYFLYIRLLLCYHVNLRMSDDIYVTEK